ncbi:MAG TPA: hypothetical protein VFT91_05950 [Dehalococcoidia bacterium]|nr:hypothetical protein [Dehalococcoidia bacterium]
MSERRRSPEQIDETLLSHVAGLPRGSQRWFKTALQTIATVDPFEGTREAEEEAPAQRPREVRGGGATLDRVIGGEADVRRETQEYPELAEELKGIAEIADLLREAGRQHRQLGEDVLRQELEEEEEEPRDEDDGATPGA